MLHLLESCCVVDSCKINLTSSRTTEVKYSAIQLSCILFFNFYIFHNRITEVHYFWLCKNCAKQKTAYFVDII